MISLGPKDNPYLKWNGERLAGAPALEARLREHRFADASCEVSVVPDRHADYQMIASVLNVIQHTDECATVDVGFAGSLGRAKSLVESTAALVEQEPLITIGAGPDGGVRWNDEPISGPSVLEARLAEYKHNHDACEVRLLDRHADYETVSDVLGMLVREGCSLAFGRFGRGFALIYSLQPTNPSWPDHWP